MIRRMIAVMLVVMSLSLALVAQAAAEPEYDTDYEVRDVSLISEGDVRSFHRVETYEQGLSWNQADELCQDLGFDEAIGIDRERYSGEGRPRARYDVVTCAGDAQPVAEVQPFILFVYVTSGGMAIPATITISPAAAGDTGQFNGVCAGEPAETYVTGSDGYLELEFYEEKAYCINAIVTEPGVVDDNFAVSFYATPVSVPGSGLEFILEFGSSRG